MRGASGKPTITYFVHVWKKKPACSFMLMMIQMNTASQKFLDIMYGYLMTSAEQDETALSGLVIRWWQIP